MAGLTVSLVQGIGRKKHDSLLTEICALWTLIFHGEQFGDEETSPANRDVSGRGDLRPFSLDALSRSHALSSQIDQAKGRQ